MLEDTNLLDAAQTVTHGRLLLLGFPLHNRLIAPYHITRRELQMNSISIR